MSIGSRGLVVLLTLVSGLVSAEQASPPQTNAPARDAGVRPRTATARIRGRVTTVERGDPLRRAEVRLTPQSGLPGAPLSASPIEAPIIITDEQGYFEFKGLPAGRYTLVASKSGYLTLSYGQRRANETGKAVEVADDRLLDNVNFSLPRGAAIVALITNEFGEPISGLTVHAQQFRFFDGARLRMNLTGPGLSGPGIATNDRGEQRLFGLPPGEYYVMVDAPGSTGWAIGPADPGRMYAPTFYPGTASFAEAQRVTLGVGQEVNVSFALVPRRAVRVSGVVRSSSGEPLNRAGINVSDRSPDSGAEGRSFAVQPDGTFVIPALFPGDYSLSVRPPPGNPNATPESATELITVADRDITGLTITTGTGATVRGRFVFDTDAPPANLRGGAVQFTIFFPWPGWGTTGRATWNPDWTFQLEGVSGRGSTWRMVTSAATSGGWVPKAFMLNGKNVIDTPLDFETGTDINDLQVILTRTVTDVSGSAVDGQGAPVSEYVAVFFPEDPALRTPRSRFIAATRPDQRGQFKLQGLPPGRYFVTALDYLRTGDEQDASLLARLVDQSTTLTLDEGEAKTISLKVTTY